ncbi:DUF551 domain-containing protein [Cronobacter sakazakii]|uniref:DUF551 domain-containing protein n=1 Tax=Cronobacter sakazakii TaxID=28141 RepID=UPI0021AB79DA|nr:DUF551 domain-containing protein [Cronobacter sakazakii]
MNTISNERLEELRVMFSPSANKDVYLALGELLALRKERERAAPVVVPDCFLNAVSALDSLYRNGQKQCWHERYTTDMAYASGVLNACRAAMLQSGNDEIGSWGNHKTTPTDKPKSEMSQQAEQLLRDTTALAATLSAEADTTAQQFESLAGKAVGGSEGFECTPVADLYELLTKCGECYDYTTSAKVAADWIKGGYSAREYVKLDRLQEAMTHGSSGEPDGWIPCSERMPPDETGVIVAKEFDGPGDWRMKWATRVPRHPDAKNGWLIPGASWTPSHWMPLPAAPVKGE